MLLPLYTTTLREKCIPHENIFHTIIPKYMMCKAYYVFIIIIATITLKRNSSIPQGTRCIKPPQYRDFHVSADAPSAPVIAEPSGALR